MASATTIAPSNGASEDSIPVTDPSPSVPPKGDTSDHPVIVPDITLIGSSTDDTSEDSDLTTDVSPVVPPVDASDVPLPDEECDQDNLEVSPLADHEGTTPGSDDVELANNEPTDLDTSDRDQDETQPGNVNRHDTSFTSESSTTSSPKPPRKQDESQTDDDDLHDSSISSMSSAESSPRTPEKGKSSSDPFIVEDSANGFSLDDLDLSSPNWMDNINSFLEKLENLEPEKGTSEKEKLTLDVGAVEEDGEYDEPVIAIPDTPDYHPFSENFQIRLSKFGGFGTFATRDLKIGEVILIEKPLLRTPRDSFYTDFRKLSEEDQETFMQLYTPPGKYSSRDASDYTYIRAIVKANSFAINPYSNDIISVYNVGSRLNHACSPVANVLFTFDANNCDAITLTIDRLVKAGSELFISYGGSPLSLYERYGFRCCCGGCEGVTDQDLTIMKKIKNVEKYLWG